uniref:Uncharacterized protein n=1 Tax=Anguilla anguilla TaxID=7936 RepID=A0A0E9TEI0_ANGAN
MLCVPRNVFQMSEHTNFILSLLNTLPSS